MNSDERDTARWFIFGLGMLAMISLYELRWPLVGLAILAMLL